MPGSWEIKANNRMLLGILHVEFTTMAWAFGLRNLIIPGQISALSGMPYDMARNVACQQALEGGFDYLAFLDSDVVPPRNAFIRLMSYNLPVVSGVYCRRSPPHGLPVAIRRNQGWVQALSGGLEEVDYVGAGLLLIKREVLEKVPPSRPGKRWFDWRVDMKGVIDPSTGKPFFPEDYCLSEDFSWCRRVQEHGYPIILDTGLVAKHVGFAQAEYRNMLPCDHNPIT